MNGLLIVNKASGPTSHRVVQEIRALFPKVKVGHAGTLDPAATGVLPICLGKATRIVEYLMDLPKEYRAELELGATTETGDAQGKITGRFPVPVIAKEAVEQLFLSLTGEQQQVPPPYSAIKYQGKPMYYWTRRGVEVKLKPRKIQIYRLELVEWRYPGRPHLVFETKCSRGTYIRTLAEEIGRRLGTGAFINALRRLSVGIFTLKEALTMDEIRKRAGLSEPGELILPVDRGLSHLPALTRGTVDIERLQQGQPLLLEQAPGPGSLCRVYDPGGRFKTLAALDEVDGKLWLKPKINF
ncbi:MAG: tRNA pseudouridine(55) synthase TruB [Firmicutes bacterium]|nr:tRNA pseudouridine(55) synthase TruB [Bacillota bacterium]